MQYLFERLDRAPLQADGPLPPFDLHAAVRTQVQRIVGARLPAAAGGQMNAPQFGMPSVVELRVGDGQQLKAYAARLLRMLRRYEPRLVQPSVRIEAGEADALQPYRLVVRGALGPGQSPQVYTFALGEHPVSR
jgi:predicted component of type VI protein secretion system